MPSNVPSFHSLPYVVGLGYTVEFRIAAGRCDAIWEPRVPDGATARALLPKYRRVRDLALGAAASSLGLNIAVIDGGGDAA